MNLSELLKQFKNIEPNATFTETSKRAILATTQPMHVGHRGIMIALRSLETGVALLLGGFFILLVTGSFSGTKYLAPVQYSVIDPAGLHAEADAIDMQIQLANLNYSEVITSSTSGSTTPSAYSASATSRALMVRTPSSATTTTSTVDGSGSDGSSTASSSLSVDEALQALTQ